jgi:hypothetical protein
LEPTPSRQRLVDPVVAEEEPDETVGRAQAAGEQRRCRVAITHQREQTVRAQRGLGPEAAAQLEFGPGVWSKQIECEGNRRPHARNVILKIGVDALISQVDLGRDSEQHDEGLERTQAAGVRHANQAPAAPSEPLRAQSLGVELSVGKLAAEQPLGLAVGYDQPGKPRIAGTVAKRLADLGEGTSEELVDMTEVGGQLIEDGVAIADARC